MGVGAAGAGLRLLPVATFVTLMSVVGTKLAVRIGNKLVISTGLGLLAAAYAWISTVTVGTSYAELAGQMVVLGRTWASPAPRTESIMGAVSTAKAGIGSAINDTTRELGATLGVAVIGSVYASLYAASLDAEALAGVPPRPGGRRRVGRRSRHRGRRADGRGRGRGGVRLQAATSAGFFDGLQAGCLVAAGICLAGAVFCAVALPSRPAEAEEDVAPVAHGGASVPAAA
jgi:hypothetical protein